MTTGRPVSAARRAMARATTSRGPSSAIGCSSSMKRRPPASRRNAPSPRTASLTSDRGLGTQRQRRGMELDHLEVGQGRAGTRRQGRSVGGGPRGVGRERVELPGAPGRQGHGPGPPHSLDAVAVHGAQAGDAAVAHEHLQGALALGQLDARVGPHGRRERGDDVGAGGVAAGVHHARGRVGALAAEAQASAVAVERHAPAEEDGDLGGPLAADAGGRVHVAQAGAGPERVREVGLHRVAPVQGGGDAPLGTTRAALAELRLGHHDHRPLLGGAQGHQASGDAGADDDDGILIVRVRHLYVSKTVNLTGELVS